MDLESYILLFIFKIEISVVSQKKYNKNTSEQNKLDWFVS